MLPAKELPPVNFVQCTMHYFSSPCKLHQDIPRSDSKSIFSLTKIHPINLKPFWQRSNTESFISLEDLHLSCLKVAFHYFMYLLVEPFEQTLYGFDIFRNNC